jgi:site-specific recombinase XerD
MMTGTQTLQWRHFFAGRADSLPPMAVKEEVVASTLNQALLALPLLYRRLIGGEVGDHLDQVIRAHKPKRLPVFMGQDEVKAVLSNPTGAKWLMASLMYAVGLRLTECLPLRVQDIDFVRNNLLVRDGKGAKDRIAMLPRSLEASCQDHIKKVKAIHGLDWAACWDRVQMPCAPDCKYPNAPKD